MIFDEFVSKADAGFLHLKRFLPCRIQFLPFALCPLLLACGGVPQTFYYTLAKAPITPVETTGNNHGTLAAVLGVEKFKAETIYEDDRLIYRESPVEVKYDHYRRWAARPAQLVTDEIIRQIDGKRLFENVISVPAAARVDYVLRGKILAFEEWDRGEQWFGKVAFKVELYEASSRRLVWRGDFDCETPAEKRLPVSVVQAISQSLHECVEELMLKLAEELKS